MAVVSRIGINYTRWDASPMRMENQREGWGGRDIVCLLFTSICFHRGRRFSATHRDIGTRSACDP